MTAADFPARGLVPLEGVVREREVREESAEGPVVEARSERQKEARTGSGRALADGPAQRSPEARERRRRAAEADEEPRRILRSGARGLPIAAAESGGARRLADRAGEGRGEPAARIAPFVDERHAPERRGSSHGRNDLQLHEVKIAEASMLASRVPC
jgi:hypothetical protein